MPRIESVGTFIGTIVESGLSKTKKGFPQFVAKFQATKKFVDDKEGMAHFELKEPAYVDWTQFAEGLEETYAYLVLFKDADNFNENTKLLNYDQLKVATGWSGTDFESLSDLVGKEILFQIKENTFEGKTNLQVSWIDAPDASPTRGLTTLNVEEVKALSKKLAFAKASPKAVSAKSAGAKPPATKAVSSVSTPSIAPTSAPKKAAASSPPKTAKVEESKGLAKEYTQEAAWSLVTKSKGDNTDDELADAWIAACGEVGGDEKSEEQFSKADWARVASIVCKDLALTVG